MQARVGKPAPQYRNAYQSEHAVRVPAVSTSEQQSSTRTQCSDVGTLARLPLELRFQIYNHVMDHDFKRLYQLDDDKIWLMPSSSKLPAIAYASKGTYRETLAALQNGNPCKLTIGAKIVTTNFMLFDYLTKSPDHLPEHYSDVLHIPSCRGLVIGLQAPCPRSTGGTLEVRQTVEDVVNLLNSLARPLPHLKVAFETSRIHGDQVFDHNVPHNDFALFAGPLYKLENAATNGVAIERFPGRDGVVDERVRRICTMVEEAVHGKAATDLVMQQLTVDATLPITAHLTKLDYFFRKDTPYPQELCKRTADLLHQLERVHVKQDKAVPLWISEATKLMSREVVTFDALKVQVGEWLGNNWLYNASAWANGHLTAWNPFYDDGVETATA